MSRQGVELLPEEDKEKERREKKDAEKSEKERKARRRRNEAFLFSWMGLRL